MNMFEEARAMAGTLKLCGLTQEALASQMGVSQSYIANKLRLLGFSPEAEEMIIKSGISERHARAILRLSDDGARRNMITRVAERGLTVRECEALIDAEGSFDAPKRETSECPPLAVMRFRDTISRGIAHLGSLGVSAKVGVSYFGKKTYLTICIEE